VTVFAVVRGQGLPTAADGFTLLAVLAAAAGYAEGARLAPLLGADQVICWALLLSLPVVLPLLVLDVARQVPSAGAAAWSCRTSGAMRSVTVPETTSTSTCRSPGA